LLLQMGLEGTAAKEEPIARGNRQQVVYRVELRVRDVEEIGLTQRLRQGPQVVQMDRALRGIAVQRQMADRHAPVGSHVQRHADLLDVFPPALRATVS